MTTTQYRYIFVDLLTDQAMIELQLTNVEFSRELNTPGSFRGDFLLGDNRWLFSNLTTPGRSGLYVERNGSLVWGGIVWSRTYNGTSQTLTYEAREFTSYFEHRRISTDYETTGLWGDDQYDIVRNLITTAFAESGGSLPHFNMTPALSGVTVDKWYSGVELKPLSEAIYELSRSDYGFDWNIDVFYDDAGNFSKYLELTRHRGLDYFSDPSRYVSDPNVHVLEFPGNIASYSYPEDAGSMATRLFGVFGKGEDNIYVQSSPYLGAGWPLYESSISMTDYADSAYGDPLNYFGLDGFQVQMTTSNLAAIEQPIVVMECVTQAWDDPQIGSFKQGDDVRVRITDPRFPTTLDTIMRVSKFTVRPGEDGPEQVLWSLVRPFANLMYPSA